MQGHISLTGQPLEGTASQWVGVCYCNPALCPAPHQHDCTLRPAFANPFRLQFSLRSQLEYCPREFWDALQPWGFQNWNEQGVLQLCRSICLVWSYSVWLCMQLTEYDMPRTKPKTGFIVVMHCAQSWALWMKSSRMQSSRRLQLTTALCIEATLKVNTWSLVWWRYSMFPMR